MIEQQQSQSTLNSTTLRKFTRHLLRASAKQYNKNCLIEDVKSHVDKIKNMTRKKERDTELTHLQEKIDKVIHTGQHIVEEEEKNKERLDELEQKIVDLTTEVEIHDSDIHKTQKKVKNISQKELDVLEITLKELEKKHARLEKKHGKSKVQHLKRQINEHKKTIIELRKNNKYHQEKKK